MSHCVRLENQRLQKKNAGLPSVVWPALRASTSAFALMLYCAFPAPAFAETISWVGPAGGDWFLSSNWYGYGRVPGLNDSAGINSTGPTIGAGANVEIDGLIVGIDTDAEIWINGSLQTDSLQAADKYPITGKLYFTGAHWDNKNDIVIGGVGTGEVYLTGTTATSGGALYLGREGDGFGALRLESSSRFDNSGTIFLGSAHTAAFGTLEVLGASTLKTGGLIIGEGPESGGNLSVEDSGSSVTVTGDMIIGGRGSAMVTISAGGVVKSLATTIIGQFDSPIQSVLTINGLGSSLETYGPFIIGDEAVARMSIGTAARVSSGAVVIGRHNVALVEISGSQTLWNARGLTIGGDESDPGGPAGQGRIQVEAGAVVESFSADLGAAAGSTGTVNVKGSGSVFAVGDDGLAVGNAGYGLLGVEAGGRVDSVKTVIGLGTDSDGRVTVSGSGSILNNTGDLYVGGEGRARLYIGTGGKVTSDTAIVGTKSASAVVAISGSGSTLTLAKTLFVGYEGAARGEVSVETGGEIRAKELSLGELGGSYGILYVAGAGSAVTVSVDSDLVDSGSTYVGWRGLGDVFVTDAGLLDTNRLVVGAQAGSNGILHVAGIGSQVKVRDALLIGGSGTGWVRVADGGALAAPTVVIAAAAGSTGVLNVGALEGSPARSGGEVDADRILFGDGDGSIVFNHSEADYHLSATISGNGRVVAENGVTTLSGHNSYSGGTTISAGTLKGTATSFGSGPIANNAQLVVDGVGTLSNNLNGSGTLEKTGAGNLVLAGNNSYSGATTISAGSLTGAANSFGSGEIVNNAQLAVDGPGTFSNVVSGTGTFEKTGSGNLVMTGNSTYSGATDVSSGKLSVNGVLASAVSVRSGAMLGGSGVIAGLSVASGGTLSPGNSIGTLTSTGDARFLSGSTYAVEIDASGASDKLAVTGAITIDNDVKLVVTPLGSKSAYDIGIKYAILTATGGITGTFSSMDENFAYLAVNVTKSSDKGTAYLSFERASQDPGLLASETLSENAQNAANAVEAAREDTALYRAALFLEQNEPQSAFSQLAGELHPSLAMALINRSQLTRDVILERMRSAFSGADLRSIMSTGAPPGSIGASEEDTVTFWSSGFGSRSRVGTDGNGATVDMSGGGMLLGLDGDVAGGIRAGLAGGYGHDTLRQGSASAGTDSYYLAAYASAVNGPASLRVGATHAFQDVETRRAISFSTLQENLTGQYDASTTQVFAEAAWRFDLDRVLLEPYATVSYVNLQTEAFAEQGGVSAVSSGSARHDQLYTTIGARLGHDIVLETGSGRAMLDIGWRHAYDNQSVMSTLFYAGGDGFSVAGTAMARDVALLNLGLSYDLGPSATLTFRYGAVFGAGVLDQSASAQLGVRF